PFHCLDCGEQLSLRLSRAKRAHFAHRPDSLCTGETALHRYAKELLAREGILTVPELILREEGLTQIVCREGRHKFDTVEIEERLET
ncbi:competence protein CoiA family protein, partial [Pseudomonas sp. FW306-02-F08-AA]|uniref:competence protein CoiA family protein n=1 Tax=Pseudomonas sp. FW306-02-F08-AA TaxID=2070651 RepID=UPI002113B1BF